MVLQLQFDVRHQRRQFRRGQAQALVHPTPDLLVGRQRLQLAVQCAMFLQIPDLTGVYGQQARGVGAAGAHQVVLLGVVGQHQLSDLVGHRLQQLRAVVALTLAAVINASTRILMLTSWSEQSTPAELSSASVLIRPPHRSNSTRPRAVTPRLPPSPTTFARTWFALTRSASLARSPTSA